MESSSYQATLGKMVCGMKVTDLYGNRISFGRATGRHFAKSLSAMLLGVGYIMVGIHGAQTGPARSAGRYASAAGIRRSEVRGQIAEVD